MIPCSICGRYGPHLHTAEEEGFTAALLRTLEEAREAMFRRAEMTRRYARLQALMDERARDRRPY